MEMMIFWGLWGNTRQALLVSTNRLHHRVGAYCPPCGQNGPINHILSRIWILLFGDQKRDKDNTWKTWKSQSGNSAAIGTMISGNLFHHWIANYNFFSTNFTSVSIVMVWVMSWWPGKVTLVIGELLLAQVLIRILPLMSLWPLSAQSNAISGRDKCKCISLGPEASTVWYNTSLQCKNQQWGV